MLLTFGGAPFGPPSSGSTSSAGAPGTYALATSAVVLSAATSIRITEPTL